MRDLTHETGRALQNSAALLRDNREGGRHRRRGRRIGRGSRRLRMAHWKRKFLRILLAIGAIIFGTTIAGMVLNGIGFVGVMAAAMAIMCAAVLLSAFPRMKPPALADINKGDAAQMVGRTQLWMEHQQLALPAPSAEILGNMGVQLDSLGAQLSAVDPAHPSVREVRQLVGEILPQTIASYTQIPPALRAETYAGTSPDAQLHESLSKISGEIDAINRKLAEGALDKMAIQSRFIEYKYGGSEQIEGN